MVVVESRKSMNQRVPSGLRLSWPHMRGLIILQGAGSQSSVEGHSQTRESCVEADFEGPKA